LSLLPMQAPPAADAPQSAPVRELQSRRVVLPESATRPMLTVRLAPGVLTVLEFDTPIDPDSLKLEAREERFARSETTLWMVALRPARELDEAIPWILEVDFTDGQSPAHATLALVRATDTVDAQVQVVRQPRSVEALEDELETVRARCEAGGFLKLAMAGWLTAGVTHEMLEGNRTEVGVKSTLPDVYRTKQYLAMTASFRLLEGAAPWMPGEAVLRNGAGRVVQRVPIWMGGTQLLPHEARQVGVELQLPSEEEPGPWSLELRERNGPRGVVFPLRKLRGAP
jgi:uncharacterized protein (TIGR02268 family)